MLLDGVNHVAIITKDTERLHKFYKEVFDATVSRDLSEQPGVRLSFVDIGPGRELNVFQVDDNVEAERQTPMFGRGRIDHLGLQANSKNLKRAIATLMKSTSACPPAKVNGSPPRVSTSMGASGTNSPGSSAQARRVTTSA
jgi:hypothetical protein